MFTVISPKQILTIAPRYALIAMLLIAIALILLVGPDLAHAGRRYAM